MSEVRKVITDKRIVVLPILIAIAVSVGFYFYLAKHTSSRREVTCSFETIKSSYKYPYWNITIKNNNGLITVTACQLQYREQMLDYHSLGAIILDKADSFTLHFILNARIKSGEPFVLWLYFSDNKFTRMNLTLPEEE